MEDDFKFQPICRVIMRNIQIGHTQIINDFFFQYYELRYNSRYVRLLNLTIGCINYVSYQLLVISLKKKSFMQRQLSIVDMLPNIKQKIIITKIRYCYLETFIICNGFRVVSHRFSTWGLFCSVQESHQSQVRPI